MTTMLMPQKQDERRAAERPAPRIPDSAWQAIASRDAGRDGQFVYGVRTTHIYCRPSCPSRQPRREHVEMFAGPALAEHAGYRACKRCDPGMDTTPDRGVALVQRACAYMDAHLDDALPLATVARAAHGSPAHLQRTFKRVLGISPRAYVAAKREERLRGALRTGQPVSRAVFAAGYGAARPAYGRARRHDPIHDRRRPTRPPPRRRDGTRDLLRAAGRRRQCPRGKPPLRIPRRATPARARPPSVLGRRDPGIAQP